MCSPRPSNDIYPVVWETPSYSLASSIRRLPHMGMLNVTGGTARFGVEKVFLTVAPKALNPKPREFQA